MWQSLQYWWESLETRPTLWLFLILCIGCGLRIGALQVKTIPLPETRQQRIATHLAATGELAYCNTYFPFCAPGNDRTASVEPIPVTIFAAFLRYFETRPIQRIVILQLFSGLLVVFTLYMISMELFGDKRSALFAALGWSTYIQMIALELTLYVEAIFTCLLSLAILALVRAITTGRTVMWMACGLGFGLAALSRSSLVYFPLLLVGILGLVPALRRTCSLKHLGLFAVTFALTLSPWVVRNFFVFRAFVPGGTLNGYNLLRHNHFLAEDNFLHYGSIEEMNKVIARLVETRQDLRGDENEHEMDRIYQQEAVQIIAAHPWRYMLLSLYRLLPLWTDIGVREKPLSPLLRFVGLENVLLLGLAAAAAIRRRGRQPPAVLPLLVLIGYFTVGHILVNARMRYIVPVMPYLIVLAAEQCVHAVHRSLGQLKATPGCP